MDEHLSAQITRVNKLLDLGQKSEALKLAKVLCQTYPDQAEVWYLAARALEKPEHRRQALTRALQANPGHRAAARMLEKLEHPSVIGVDGELVIPMPVEVEKPKRAPGNAGRLTARLFLLCVGVLVLFGGAGIAAFYLRSVDEANANKDDVGVAFFPGKFNRIPYDAGVKSDTDDERSAPCQTRTVRVQVKGGPAVAARVWTWPDEGDLDSTVSLEAPEWKTTFEIPTDQAEVFNLYLYDEQGNEVTGLEDIAIGSRYYPGCTLITEFKWIGD